jgi:hypothetical protein
MSRISATVYAATLAHPGEVSLAQMLPGPHKPHWRSTKKELFNSGESFLRLLGEVFSGSFRATTKSHLHNFHAIVPVLTFSYLVHIAQLKGNAQKLNRNASFSDDRFPMGLV